MPKPSIARNVDELEAYKLRRVVAVVVGVEKYQEQKNPISGVAFAGNDATEFCATLKDIFGEKLEEMLFVDSQATRSTLNYQLGQAISSLGEDDLFVFYFAGHGFQGSSGNHLAVFDTLLADISGTGLSLRQAISDKLKKSDCRRSLIFVDACARPFELELGRDGLSDLSEEELAEFLAATDYCAVYLSCKPGQASYPSKPLKHGIWTYFLLRALRRLDDAALDSDGFLTDVSLRNYLKRSVPKYINGKTTIKAQQDPYAIIEAASSFRLPSVPRPTRAVSESSDLSKITGKIRREYFEDVSESGVRRLKEFKSGSHRVPTLINRSTSLFVEKLLAPEIAEIFQTTYQAVKDAFGLKRADIERNSNEAVGTLDTKYFRFEIRGEQSPDDASKYRITRTLEIRQYDSDLARKIDQAFGSFDSIVIEVDLTNLDFEEVTANLEVLAEDHGGHAEDDDAAVCYTTAAGESITVDFENERIIFSLQRPAAASQIAHQLGTFRFGLSGDSQLVLG